MFPPKSDGQADKQTYGLTDGHTDGLTDGWTDGRTLVYATKNSIPSLLAKSSVPTSGHILNAQKHRF